jgi:hypothetical protein
MGKDMILEMSIALLLRSEDRGFYIGPMKLEKDGIHIQAHSFIIKLWYFMIQFTAYGEV